jgi:hypothetical protein
MGTEVIIPAPEALVSPQFAAGAPEIEATSDTAVTTTNNPTEVSSVTIHLEEHELNPHTMGEPEVIAVVQREGSKCKHFKQTFELIAEHVHVLRKRYAKKGKRLPLPGKPTWADFVKDTFGITDRYLRMLTSPAKNGPNVRPEPLDPGDAEALFNRMRRKPFAGAMDEVFKELDADDFAFALEGLAQLITRHYSMQDAIHVDVAPIDEDDLDAAELDCDLSGPDSDSHSRPSIQAVEFS